jgi:hypothetical protein
VAYIVSQADVRSVLNQVLDDVLLAVEHCQVESGAVLFLYEHQ